MEKFFQTIMSFLMSIYILFANAGLMNTGVNRPIGFEALKKYDMPPDGYDLVMEDNFEGDKLDADRWICCDGPSRGGYYDSKSQIKVEDGFLKMKFNHLDNGRYGEGWYSASIRTQKKYTRGYFECRCRCNRTYSGGSWSAFWLQPGNPYDAEISKGGIGGAEIDIMETFVSHSHYDIPKVEGAIHCNGSKKNADYRAEHPEKTLDTQLAFKYFNTDVFDEFHTYSLLWDEDNYTFFIDGKVQAVTDWADGVSTAPAEVRLSLEQGAAKYAPEDKTTNSEFTVDYVRVYQPADDIQIAENF